MSLIDITVRGAGAAAGTFYYSLVFTGTGEASNTLSGYPSVLFLDEEGRYWSAPEKNPVNPIVDVTVLPGKSAYATLAIPDWGVYGSSPARTKVRWLVVTIAGHFPKVAAVTPYMVVVSPVVGPTRVSAVSASVV